jgi:cell division protease FtsH
MSNVEESTGTRGAALPAAKAPPRLTGPAAGADATLLAGEWRRLRQAATAVAIFTSPMFFVVMYDRVGLSVVPAILATVGSVIAFRGLVDVAARRVLPWPSMYGVERSVAEEDVVARRRTWFWRSMYRKAVFLAILIFAIGGIIALAGHHSWIGGVAQIFDAFGAISGSIPGLLVYVFFLFFINTFILFGPLLVANLRQVRGYEPGDANWGVSMEDVRGQAEPKEEVARVVRLWQSGEEFEKAGGKRERGLLFLGAPGTGKTMLAKAIATNFNSPFVTIPGSGFAATFIGIDVIVVMWLIRKAKKLARKWGGQCIVFIDEIDAVGMRRASLGAGIGEGTGHQPLGTQSFEDYAFFGPWGSLTPTGDLILETRVWRERLFSQRATSRGPAVPPLLAKPAEWIQRVMFPGMFGGAGGGLALNQLLVQMDGIGEAPFLRRFFANRINNILDATYLIPRKIRDVSLRLPAPGPAPEQVFFIGATNVPIDRLDPALIRPGRMGRHVWFRTPTLEDRKDIFNLYLAKVDHQPDLDTERRRDELARITNGYSPAMIEQVCSLALTYSHADGRQTFGWPDIVEAMTTVEAGTAVAIDYIPEETKAVAIHEAGHAVNGHLYMKDVLSTRLSIRKRGESLGHHQAIQTQERFSSWRSDEFSKLVWTLGAMAAEHVFYGENSTGVGGDVMSATSRAAWMVGMCAMGPNQIDLNGRFASAEEEAAEREKLYARFEEIGVQIMNRANMTGPYAQDPIAAVLGDRDKRKAVAGLLGQAYVTAYVTVAENRERVEHIAEELIKRKEMHGDEVVDLLNSVDLVRPDIDLLEERVWPPL